MLTNFAHDLLGKIAHKFQPIGKMDAHPKMTNTGFGGAFDGLYAILSGANDRKPIRQVVGESKFGNQFTVVVARDLWADTDDKPGRRSHRVASVAAAADRAF